MYSSRIVEFVDNDRTKYILVFNKPFPKHNLVRTILKRFSHLHNQIRFNDNIIYISSLKRDQSEIEGDYYMQNFLIDVHRKKNNRIRELINEYIADFENYYGHIYILYHSDMRPYELNALKEDKMQEIEYY